MNLLCFGTLIRRDGRSCLPGAGESSGADRAGCLCEGFTRHQWQQPPPMWRPHGAPDTSAPSVSRGRHPHGSPRSASPRLMAIRSTPTIRPFHSDRDTTAGESASSGYFLSARLPHANQGRTPRGGAGPAKGVAVPADGVPLRGKPHAIPSPAGNAAPPASGSGSGRRLPRCP